MGPAEAVFAPPAAGRGDVGPTGELPAIRDGRDRQAAEVGIDKRSLDQLVVRGEAAPGCPGGCHRRQVCRPVLLGCLGMAADPRAILPAAPSVVVLLERYDRKSAAIGGETGAGRPATVRPCTETELGQSDREFFLQLYRYALGRYQPILEERIGVSLGHIEVKPISELAGDTARKLGPFSFTGRAGRLLAAIRGRWAARRVGYWSGWSWGVYWRKAIYVNFTFGVDGHEDAIAQLVVHELAHRLWERLGGRLNLRPFRQSQWLARHQLVGEGYATYIERVWLLDAYPPSQRKRLEGESMDPASIYTQGLRLVTKAVAKMGPDALKLLPRRWWKLIDFESGSA